MRYLNCRASTNEGENDDHRKERAIVRGGPRGIAKDVVKSQTAVYKFTPADLCKRLRLPEGTRFFVQYDTSGTPEGLHTIELAGGVLQAEVKS